VIFLMRQHQHTSPLRRTHLRSHPHQCSRLMCRGICWREKYYTGDGGVRNAIYLLSAARARSGSAEINHLPSAFYFYYYDRLDVQVKHFDWGSRIEVGVQGSSPGVTLSSRRFAAYHPRRRPHNLRRRGLLRPGLPGCVHEGCEAASGVTPQSHLGYRISGVGDTVAWVSVSDLKFRDTDLGFRSLRYCHQRTKYLDTVTLNLNPEP